MNARLLFALNAMVLVMLAMSAPFIEIGSGAFVVSVIALGFVTISMVGLGAVMWYQQRQTDGEEPAPLRFP